MKQQDISQQLGSLITQTSGIYNNVAADEAIPSELKEPDPLFEINHKDEQSVARAEALETMKYIVGSVVPEQYINEPIIQNKMKLDAVQLGQLYYQQKMNNITLQTAMDVLAKGDTQPRMFEVIEKLQKRASDLSELITETQNQFRKYYIDTYMDVEVKKRADEAEHDLLTGPPKEKVKEIAASKESVTMKDDGSVRTISTKNTIEQLQKIKIEAAKRRKKQELASEVQDYQEVE